MKPTFDIRFIFIVVNIHMSNTFKLYTLISLNNNRATHLIFLEIFFSTLCFFTCIWKNVPTPRLSGHPCSLKMLEYLNGCFITFILLLMLFSVWGVVSAYGAHWQDQPWPLLNACLMSLPIKWANSRTATWNTAGTSYKQRNKAL